MQRATAARVATAATDPAIPIPATAAEAATDSRHVSRQHHGVSVGTLEAPLAALYSDWLRPAVVVLALLAADTFCRSAPLRSADVALGFAAAITSRQLFTPLRASDLRPVTMLAQWALVVGVLLLSGTAFGLADLFSPELLAAWLGMATVGLLTLEFTAPLWALAGARPHRYLIVGANELAMECQRREARSNGASVFLGYFDF